MKQSDIKGTGVALVTPFKEDSSIDFDALKHIINNVVSGGCDFLVVLGTTGEASLLSLDEKLALIAFVKEHVDGRLPIVLGYGGINTMQMIDDMALYDFSGIDALLVVTPFYVKPSQEGLYAHFKAIADATPCPVILYNVPGRTGINMESDTTLRLSLHPNIMGIKEASGKLFQIEDIIMRKSADFMLYSGDDALTFHLVNAGADGVISVMANAFPKDISSIVNGALGVGDIALAKELHLKLKVITKAVFADGNPCGIKYLLSRLGLCSNVLRLPLVPVSDPVAKIIDSELR